jgi:pimeloyl-ACP methyl ester carboxylesterase
MQSQNLVLIASQLCTAAVWQHQLAALGGRAVITGADQRNAAYMTDIACNLLAAAPPRFALAAHGMGGFVAFEVWRQAPERIERLALLDTLAAADTPAQTVRRQVYADLVRHGRFEQVIDERLPILLHPEHQHDAELIDCVRSMANETGSEAFLRQQQAIMNRPDSRPTLATINCPTLIIIGRQDRITSLADAQLIADGIAGARLEIVEKSGHLTPLEQPVAVTSLLGTWLAA